MTKFRIRFAVLGGHVRCRLFSGDDPEAGANCGSFIVRRGEEFRDLAIALGKGFTLIPDDPAFGIDAASTSFRGRPSTAPDWHDVKVPVKLTIPKEDRTVTVVALDGTRGGPGQSFKVVGDNVVRAGERIGFDIDFEAGTARIVREPKGRCKEGDRCICGGDTPTVRAGCQNWIA